MPIFITQTDTVFQATDKAIDELNKAANLPNAAINGLADSLQFINKAYSAEQNALDSVNRLLSAPADKISEIERKLESPTVDRYNNITSEVNEGLGNVGINHGIEQQGGIGAADQLRPGGADGLLPTTPDIPGLDATTNALDKVNQATEVLDKAQGITEQTKNIGVEVGNISRGDFENTEALSGMAEGQVQNTEAFKTLSEEAGGFDGLPISADGELMTAQEWQQQGMQIAREEAIDHFVGREAQLSAAMKQMSKLKGKYSDVPRLDKSEMVKASSLKGHPWQERIYPVLNFQVVNGDQVTVDFMPGITYRFSTMWLVTAGGMFRTHFYKDKERPGVVYDLHGFYTQGEFRFFKTFSAVAEIERLEVTRSIPASSVSTYHFTDWNYMVGIKKDYSFSRHVKGIMMVMYNFDYTRNLTPYPSRWHMRFGLSYRFKKKVKTAENTVPK